MPPELGDLANLEEMNLAGIGLSGDLPGELARLSNLKNLILPGNNLSGSIPSWLTELTNLQILYLAYNDFSGEIPKELGKMGSLVRLELGDNNLTGQIPAELGLLEDLVRLGLENNRLSGDIPDELDDLHSLLLLGIAGNPQLGGCVPSYLALQLDSSSELGNVPVCGGLALGGPTATIAVAPTVTRPGPVATLAPTWVPTGTPWSTPTRAAPAATSTPWPTPTRAAPVATSTPWHTPTRAAPVATSTPWPTPTRAAPVATSTPWPTPSRSPTLTPVTRPPSLEEYARQNAGGPGAIYVGDLRQLAGPAPEVELGNRDGNVSLDSLERHLWIYESDYYQELLAKARLTDPTPLTTTGQRINIQFACINRTLNPCKLLENFFVPNVERRTNGQLTVEITSFPELRLAGPEVLDYLSNGTLEATTVPGGYIAGQVPAFDIQNLWGIYSTADESYAGAEAMIVDLESRVLAETGGVAFSHSWYAGNDQFLFCRDAIESRREFRGRATRSHGSLLSDWLGAMGARSQILALAEVYTPLERGVFDCGVTGADAALGQRWYEVARYVMGPLYSISAESNAINARIWNEIPADLQQIILEEGAKLELEALRLVAAQNEVGVTRLRDAGMEYVPFSTELQRLSRQAAVNQVIPGWIERVGDTNDPIIADTFNNKVGPIVGMRINSDGSVTDLR